MNRAVRRIGPDLALEAAIVLQAAACCANASTTSRTPSHWNSVSPWRNPGSRCNAWPASLNGTPRKGSASTAGRCPQAPTCSTSRSMSPSAWSPRSRFPHSGHAARSRGLRAGAGRPATGPPAHCAVQQRRRPHRQRRAGPPCVGSADRQSSAKPTSATTAPRASMLRRSACSASDAALPSTSSSANCCAAPAGRCTGTSWNSPCVKRCTGAGSGEVCAWPVTVAAA